MKKLFALLGLLALLALAGCGPDTDPVTLEDPDELYGSGDEVVEDVIEDVEEDVIEWEDIKDEVELPPDGVLPVVEGPTEPIPEE